jgi:hypothetical protein
MSRSKEFDKQDDIHTDTESSDSDSSLEESEEETASCPENLTSLMFSMALVPVRPDLSDHKIIAVMTKSMNALMTQKTNFTTLLLSNSLWNAIAGDV